MSASKGFNTAKNQHTLTMVTRQSQHTNEEQSPTFHEKSNKLQSYSLELRRRTDQQGNYMSRTLANYKNAPIGVEDQKNTSQIIDRPQRSVDIVDILKNTKVKNKVRA